MTEASKEARRAYKREWARKNPEKVRAAQDRYWQRRAAAQAAQGAGETMVNQLEQRAMGSQIKKGA